MRRMPQSAESELAIPVFAGDKWGVNDGEICARRLDSGAPLRVTWRARVVTRIEAEEEQEVGDWWIAPGLVDLQINGFAGVDFQRDDLTLTEMESAVAGLHAAGCTRFLLTLITADWPVMLARLERLRSLRSQSPRLAAAMAGWHLEGPFLSAEAGFCGAHDAACMTDPSPARVEELGAVAGDDPVLLTLAPERRGALETIRRAVELGMVVSLGHTDASAAQLRAAVAAGATSFTHLGNGCPRLLDRADNILWRALDTPGLRYGLIPDALHIAPALLRLLHRARPATDFWFTTDAMAAAGQPPGRYRLGNREVEVGADLAVWLPGRQQFAGSALQPFRGVLCAAAMLGRSWREVWPGFAHQPARLLGWNVELLPGNRADFCLVRTEGGKPVELRVCVAGRWCAGVDGSSGILVAA